METAILADEELPKQEIRIVLNDKKIIILKDSLLKAHDGNHQVVDELLNNLLCAVANIETKETGPLRQLCACLIKLSRQ